MPAYPFDITNMQITTDGRTLYAVANVGQGGVVPINLANGSTEKTIGIPDAAAIAISTGGRMAYVVTGSKDTITSINLATRTIGKVIPLPRANPSSRSYYGIALSPDDRTAYAVDGYGNVVPVNLITDSVGIAIDVPLGTAGPIAITPNGRTAYVITGTGGNVGNGPEFTDISAVDLTTGSTGNPIVVPNDAYDVAISPDGRSLYVTTTVGVVPVNVNTGKPGKPVLRSSGKNRVVGISIAVAPVNR
jgi:hyaluronoglucosaminidase